MVASWAPSRDRILRVAQLPKAALPPVRFMSCTIVPRMTRKIRIPTFQESAREAMMPSVKMWVMVPSKLNPEYRRDPVRIPIKSEL